MSVDKADNDPVIAKPSGACCLQANIHDGEPRGSRTNIAGLDTYVVEPREGKGNGNILLYFADVYGFWTNNFLIMDGFADAGYLTLALDYFQGDSVAPHRGKPDFDLQSWINKHMEFAVEATPKWVSEVEKKYGNAGTKFNCVGYCFGASFVFDQLSKGGICTAGGVAHPAFLKESHFRNLERPVFLSCAETDHTFPNESRNRAVDILQEEKKRFQVQLFQGVAHGFALRGDINNPYERYTKEQSLLGLASWFDLWCSIDVGPSQRL